MLRALLRLSGATLHVLHGVGVVLLHFPWLDDAGRARRVQWWNAKMLRRMGLRHEVSGQFRPGAKLVVANHISWLDILAINAVAPVRFVSKAEVKRWPVLGALVTAGGTLYIERERARDAMRVVHHMAEALKAGDTVAVFPEGTTADGHALLPFHANLFQAAIATQSPVQAVALRYRDATHDISPAVSFVGDTTLLQSVWWVARAQGLSVHVNILPAQATAHADRRALAARMAEEISLALTSPQAPLNPPEAPPDP